MSDDVTSLIHRQAISTLLTHITTGIALMDPDNIETARVHFRAATEIRELYGWSHEDILRLGSEELQRRREESKPEKREGGE